MMVLNTHSNTFKRLVPQYTRIINSNWQPFMMVAVLHREKILSTRLFKVFII